MKRVEICKHIDDAANFYLRLFGGAEHMEYLDNGYYSIIKPKVDKKAVHLYLILGWSIYRMMS